uniref:Gamma-glutamyltransferase 5 n=1 Tax=Ornithorhynchus anatinus TaxID=9258 RepID=A0A6I8P1Q9_ORNAN
MAYGKLCCFLLLTLGILAAIIAPTIILTSKPSQARCRERGYLHGAVAADSKACSDIGRDVLKKQGSAVDAAIAALICTSVINPQSMGLGGGVIFTIYNATTGKIEVINARETLPKSVEESLLSHCNASYSTLGHGKHISEPRTPTGWGLEKAREWIKGERKGMRFEVSQPNPPALCFCVKLKLPLDCMLTVGRECVCLLLYGILPSA